MVFQLAMLLAAALAGWSWWTAARAEQPFPRREAELLVCYAGANALARLVDLVGSHPAHVVAGGLLLIGACLALVATAAIVRRITALIGGMGVALAESFLVAASVTTLIWVLAARPPTQVPPPDDLLQALPAMVDLAVLALLLRLSVLVPDTLPVPANRQIFAFCGAAVLITCAADGIAGMQALAGHGRPGVLHHCVAVAGYLVVAAAARMPEPPISLEQPAPRVRALPYVLASTAVLAVCIDALVGPIGPMPVVLVSLVVVSLVFLQAFTLQENTALVASLTSSRTRLTALVENTSDLIVRLDANGRVLAANAAAIRLLHRQPHALTGRSFDDLARAEDRRAVREAVLDVTRGRTDAAQVELRLAPPATGTAQLRLRSVPGGAVANLNDVTDSVELRHRLERLARYDQMTGLVNRNHLLEVVAGWLAEPESDVAVLYADLDGFKAVNDRFGHAAGDRVLSEVASRFDALTGGLDARRAIVGRVGGDEFVIGLEGSGPGDALLAAQRVVEAISPAFVVGDRPVTLGVSVGVSGAGPGHGQRVDGRDAASELVHRADLAMYEAKDGGREGVGRWTPELEERARRRVDIAIGLRDALDTGRLAVAYQPIVRLADGIVIGAEALLRLPPGVGLAGLVGRQADLDGPDELVSPAELVAVAEDTGIINEMGEWVLTQAVQEAAVWAAAGLTATVSVNMSVHQLVSPTFVDSVRQILRACELPPSQLVLELTESQLAGQIGACVQALERLRTAGVRVAIDDFGTGYSSLSYLRRMPVQLVKLDRTLLDDVGVDPRATALARSVVSMARDLGLLVVAEGMEDLESVRLLRDLGAYAGQGFALSQALPAEEMFGILGEAMDLGLSRVGLPGPATDDAARPGGAEGPRTGPDGVGPAEPDDVDAAGDTYGPGDEQGGPAVEVRVPGRQVAVALDQPADVASH